MRVRVGSLLDFENRATAPYGGISLDSQRQEHVRHVRGIDDEPLPARGQLQARQRAGAELAPHHPALRRQRHRPRPRRARRGP
jgi:hypothetical protein